MSATGDFNIYLLSDEPCSVDEGEELEHLGMESTARVLSGIVNGTPGPFTVGLFGDWGSGKTTVLHKAAQYCNFNDKTLVLRVNPWEHEREPNAVQSLLQELIFVLDEERTDKPKLTWAEEIVVRLRVIAARSHKWINPKTLTWAGFAAATYMGAPEVAVAANAVGEAMPDAEAPKIQEERNWKSARQHLTTAVPPGYKIVVFLDDMDRCEAGRAVEILEAIKHLLWVPGFVFVLALDVKAVKKYLTTRYLTSAEEQEAKLVAERFLEKLVQAQVNIAHRDTKTFHSYVKAKLEEAIENNKDWIPNEIETGAVPALIAAAAHRVPRQVKRLINNVIIDWASFRSRHKELTAEDAACLALSRVLFDLAGDKKELDRLPSFDQYAFDFDIIVLHSQEIHDSLLREAKSDGKALAGRSLDIWRRYGLQEVIHDPLFRPWLKDVTKRLRWCAYSAPESRSVNAKQEQIDLVHEDLRRVLRLSQIQSLPRELVLPEMSFNHRVDDEGLAYFLSLQPTQLSELSLTGTQITDNGIDSLSQLTDLIKLSLSGTRVSDKGIKSLGQLKSLRMLNLFDTDLTDEGIKNLAHITSLTELLLGGPKVTEMGIRSLAPLTSLTTLYFMDTELSDHAIENLVHLTSLKSLHLTNSRLTAGGVKYLERFNSLTDLNLGYTNVADEGIASLQTLTSLRGLYLYGTKVTDEGIKNLVKLTSLTALDLSNTEITDSGIKCLTALTKLTYLDCQGTKVTKNGVAWLKDALPSCGILN